MLGFIPPLNLRLQTNLVVIKFSKLSLEKFWFNAPAFLLTNDFNIVN